MLTQTDSLNKWLTSLEARARRPARQGSQEKPSLG